MPLFRVELSVVADMKASVEVEAADAKQAEALAVEEAKEGNASWKYDGTYDNTIEVSRVQTGG